MRTATVTQTDWSDSHYGNPDEFLVEFFTVKCAIAHKYTNTFVDALTMAETWCKTGIIVSEVA